MAPLPSSALKVLAESPWCQFLINTKQDHQHQLVEKTNIMKWFTIKQTGLKTSAGTYTG